MSLSWLKKAWQQTIQGLNEESSWGSLAFSTSSYRFLGIKKVHRQIHRGLQVSSKDKSPEVTFHRITLSCSYFEGFEFLRQFTKKQNMIMKKYQLNRNKKFVDKAQQCNVLPFNTSSQNSNLLYSEVDSKTQLI